MSLYNSPKNKLPNDAWHLTFLFFSILLLNVETVTDWTFIYLACTHHFNHLVIVTAGGPEFPPRAHVAKFFVRLQLICSVLRASTFSVLKFIEIVTKEETLTPPGHLVSPLVCRGPWMSNVVIYCWCHTDSASVLLYFTFCGFITWHPFWLQLLLVLLWHFFSIF